MSRIAIKDERELAGPTRQAAASLSVDTNGAGFFDITAAVEAWTERHGFGDGLLSLFVRHTSASLTIQENADPDVRADLMDALDRLAPKNAPWRHANEGPDDMPGHVKSALTDTTLTIPVRDGALSLGTWQSIFLIEHRQKAQSRSIELHYLGS